MIKNIVVEVERREETGKNANRRLRAAGLVPGIVYGLDRPAFPIKVAPRSIENVLKQETGRNTIVELTLKGEERRRSVMIREIQRDPLSETMLHLDFVRVDLAKKLHVDVPVELVGTAEGVKNQGGVLDFVHRAVAVECLPENIPDHIKIDVSALNINQHVAVSDLTLREGVVILDAPETIIAVVSPPRKVEEAVPAEGEEAAAAAEPEEAGKAKEGEAEAAEGAKGD